MCDVLLKISHMLRRAFKKRMILNARIAGFDTECPIAQGFNKLFLCMSVRSFVCLSVSLFLLLLFLCLCLRLCLCWFLCFVCLSVCLCLCFHPYCHSIYLEVSPQFFELPRLSPSTSRTIRHCYISIFSPKSSVYISHFSH